MQGRELGQEQSPAGQNQRDFASKVAENTFPSMKYDLFSVCLLLT